ncbi:histone-fold-containing protein [Talaromyces proteolyticus]|uniref:DNA polymerase epsilon subunit D n=1 Tax=Talaromyces proteolyticus TaxID=1131652 RepID=A0AAD4KUX8_9EURO|nr:histone-fold-containing protein [Talaromyces proteolyticus]KAH8697296.1 histone-fold-containing protein [Talaromyces proteolyticus]
MPPRKSTSSIPPTDGEETSTAGAQTTEQQLKAQADGVGVEDLLLPRSVTQRLAKSVLPPNTTIQKDALLAIQKAATVFVSYLSSHANDATLKRTLAPSDVLSVLSELEFDALRPRLERELDAHTEAQAGKKRATKEKKAAASEGNPENVLPKGATGGEDEDATAPGAKRVKRDSDGHEKTIHTTTVAEDTEIEEPDEDETEEVEEVDDEEEEEESDEDGDETQDAEDLDHVEDLDRHDRVEDNSDSEGDDEDGPAAQLRSNMGLG